MRKRRGAKKEAKRIEESKKKNGVRLY